MDWQWCTSIMISLSKWTMSLIHSLERRTLGCNCSIYLTTLTMKKKIIESKLFGAKLKTWTLMHWVSLCTVSLFVALVSLGPRVIQLVVDLSLSQSFLLWFGLLRISSRSARCSLVSVSIFHSLCCSSHQVTLLILDLCPSPSFFLCFANTSSRSAHCRLQCLNLNLCRFGLLNTSSWSARCWLVSTVETVCFNLSSFVLKPRLSLLPVQLSQATF